MIQDPAEEARTVESWNAKPVDRAVARDERRPTTVPDQPVVLERKVGLLPHFGRRFSKHADGVGTLPWAYRNTLRPRASATETDRVLSIRTRHSWAPTTRPSPRRSCVRG